MPKNTPATFPLPTSSSASAGVTPALAKTGTFVRNGVKVSMTSCCVARFLPIGFESLVQSGDNETSEIRPTVTVIFRIEERAVLHEGDVCQIQLVGLAQQVPECVDDVL